MTRERIEDMREVVLPFVKKRLLETNYEGLGEDDAKEFEREFNEILNLAIKALKQEPFINKPCVSSGVCEHDKQKVLDKIRAEIEQIVSRYSISRERGGMGQVEWSDRLIKESEVLKILDKYKAESEE